MSWWRLMNDLALVHVAATRQARKPPNAGAGLARTRACINPSRTRPSAAQETLWPEPNLHVAPSAFMQREDLHDFALSHALGRLHNDPLLLISLRE